MTALEPPALRPSATSRAALARRDEDGRLFEALMAVGARAVRLIVPTGQAFGLGTAEGAPDHVVPYGKVSVLVWGLDRSQVDAMVALAATTTKNRDQVTKITAAMVETNDRLLTMFDLARLRVDSLDPELVVRTIIEASLRISKAEACALVEPDGRVLTAGEDGHRLQLLTDYLQTSDHTRSTIRRVGDASMVIVPVQRGKDEPAMLGVARAGVRPFLTSDQRLVEAIASTLSSMLELVRLHADGVARAVMAQEHATASKFAQATLADRLPQVPGVELFARSVPARSAGGDFYTFAHIGDMLYQAVGDIAGKGLPAALVMTRVVMASQTAFARADGRSLDDVLAEIDDQVHAYLAEWGLFATMVLSAHDTRTGVTHVCNAGHSPAMVLLGDEVVDIAASIPPIGVIPGLRADVTDYVLSPGDLLIVGSDGLTEQNAEDGDAYGYERLQDQVRATAALPADTIGERLLDDVEAFAGGLAASDDRTLVVMKVTGEGGDVPVAVHDLVVPADFLSLRELTPWIDDVFASAPVPLTTERRALVELALHELCTNIVDHAYAGTRGAIELTATVHDTRVDLVVRDDGAPYRAGDRRYPNPDEPQVRGYGLMILDQLADVVAYTRLARSNRWHLSFAFEQRAGDRPPEEGR